MGKKEGRGVFEWPEGSKYVGEFFDNEIEGWGRYDWPDGRVYCGQWLDNKMHGYGWFFWFNGQIYRGQYDQVGSILILPSNLHCFLKSYRTRKKAGVNFCGLIRRCTVAGGRLENKAVSPVSDRRKVKNAVVSSSHHCDTSLPNLMFLGVWQNGSRLEWLGTAEDVANYKQQHGVPEDPELPSLPDWLEELCKSAYPAWYKEQLEKKPATNGTA